MEKTNAPCLRTVAVASTDSQMSQAKRILIKITSNVRHKGWYMMDWGDKKSYNREMPFYFLWGRGKQKGQCNYSTWVWSWGCNFVWVFVVQDRWETSLKFGLHGYLFSACSTSPSGTGERVEVECLADAYLLGSK